jgi:mono/diheme cytochrome c family protein
MKRAIVIVLIGLGLSPCPGRAAAPDFKRTAGAFFDRHCLECHGGKQTKADLDLKLYKDDKDIIQRQKDWRNIFTQINSGEMPPKKHKSKPTPEEINALNDAYSAAVARAEAKLPPDPGHVTVRRLNRKEYNNTVRDLLGVDFNPAENFPADDIGHGFDNIGDVLNLSPVHLERYLDAAETIASRAILLKLPPAPTRTTSSNFLGPRRDSESSNRPVTNSPPEFYLYQPHILKDAGEYVFLVRAYSTNAPGVEPAKMTLILNDKPVGSFVVTNATEGRRRSAEYEVKLTLPAGSHSLRARFDNPPTETDKRMLYINEFKLVGPADTRSDFMKRVDAVVAGKDGPERVRAVVEWFLTRAFRRPPSKDELVRYGEMFAAAQAEGQGQWEAGLQGLVKVVLCSPKFLFRVELDDRPRAKDNHPLDEFQLASRLSYFLWSTTPDDELLALATKQQLTPNLPAQVQRMLKDPRAEALVKNFGLQWLQIERLATFAPDKTLFPDFDERLRQSMLRETELFLAEIVREDRSVLELVDADFTYLNRTLAQHYGIEVPQFADTGGDRSRFGFRRSRGGDPTEFIRVALTNKTRGGLLTQGSILTVTSNPTRTSPVKRGKWVLEQILGTPPPPAPPGVAELDAQKQLTGTLRQRMEQHREDPRCASCHFQMDSMGFAFENYDAIGRYRSRDGEGAIDPAGELPDGSKFDGPAQLKEILKNKKDLVARNIAEKLLTYALGRGLEYYDERALRKIVADLGAGDYKFSILATSIVTSDPFRLRRGTKLIEQHAGAE